MKIISLIITTIFCCAFCCAQKQSIALPASFINIQNISLASPTGTTSSLNTEDAKCHRYRTMKITGDALLISGGAIFVAGAIMAGIGLAGAEGEHTGPQPKQQNGSTGPLIAGLVCLATGSGFMIAGFPVAIIGTRSYKRYCRNTGNRSYMQISTGGTNLALNF